MFPIEVFQKTISEFVKILDSVGIRFHLTGGITSAVYGQPRMTQDIDVVIDPLATRKSHQQLIVQLRSSVFIFNEREVQTAVERQGMFQLLDRNESLKLDVYPRELIAGELERSEPVEIFKGQLIPVVSLADAVTSKLIWIEKGSHKSRSDLRAMWRVADDQQRRRIENNAKSLQLTDLLKAVIDEPDEIR